MASLWNRVRSLLGLQPAKSDPALRYIHKDDPEMKAAWQKAREAVPEFIAALDDPALSDADFYVKKRFEQGDLTEHIWLLDVRVEGEEFVGEVGNDPQIVTTIKLGDTARVAMPSISDWMIDGDEMRGGFTVELLQRRARKPS